MGVMRITRFSSLYSKEAECVIDAREWMEAIRDGKYRTTVEQIRELLAKGMKEEAGKLKLRLPAVVPAGVCMKGRFFKHTTERTGHAPLDFDNLDEGQIKAAAEIIRNFPWVVMMHVTSSGRGLRVIANIGMVHIDVYRDAYEIVADFLRTATGLEPDMACKDFARASLASYDPDVYYNPDATVFEYGERNPLNYVVPAGPDPSEDFRYQTTVPEIHKGNNNAGMLKAGTAQRDKAAMVIERFFSRNPYTRGSRHNTLLHLGGYLKWWGIEPHEMEQTLSMIFLHTVQTDMTEKEVRNAVMWGYDNGRGNTEHFAGNCGHNGHKTNMNPLSVEKDAYVLENEDAQGDEKDEDEMITECCPILPDDVFGNLPEELGKLLVIAKDKRERDIILISAITMLSGMFPALRTIYGNQKYSPQIFTCILGEAGSGKGTAMHSVTLGKEINDEFEKIYRQEKKDYEKKLLVWEMELKKAFSEKRLPDTNLKPEEPTIQTFTMQANTSKSQFLRDLMKAGDDGGILTISEMEALAEALNTDFGRHTAELRMIFHHEKVGLRYRTDKEPVSVESPRLAMMMTGTPEQMVDFIKTMENGMFSRIMFYMLPPVHSWKSQSPLDASGGIDAKELFGKLSVKLKVNFFKTRGKRIDIKFTREQWDRHKETFQTELGVMAGECNHNSVAIVVRAGLIMIRVAMVLCGLRIMEAGWDVNEYTCSDEDFDCAMKIVLTAMEHSVHVSTMIEGKQKRKKLTNFYRLLPVLKSMKKHFRYHEFRDAAIDAGLNATAAKRALGKYVENGLISRTYDGYRKEKLLDRRFNGYL